MDHYYRSVPGWAAFADLYVWAVKNAPKQGARFVEVGSWLGRSASLMGVEIINSGKDIEFVCIDPWTDGGPDLRHTNHFKKLTEPVYDQFLRNTAPVAHVCKFMKMTSVEASRHLPDNSVNFIMLDGDHGYEGIRADIDAWLPKMKRGHSVMSGDDYTWPGVKKAVDETFGVRAQVIHKKRHANYLNAASYWTVVI